MANISRSRFLFPAKAVAFDLDDTLFDRRAALAGLLEKWTGSSVGVERLIAMDGLSQAEFFGQLSVMLSGSADVRSVSRRFRAAFPAYVRPDPAVIVTLERLMESQVPLGLLSNGSPGMQRVKLRACRVERFFPETRRVFSGEVGVEKPDPRAFHLLASRLGCEPGEILFVGDDPVRDIAGSAAAGMMTCRLRRPGRSGECAGVTIESMAELPMLLTALA